MNDHQYKELFGAIIDLREATELGFKRVDARFEIMEERWDKRFQQMEERWDRRFTALENRVETGFAEVASSLRSIDVRLTHVERRFV